MNLPTKQFNNALVSGICKNSTLEKIITDLYIRPNQFRLCWINWQFLEINTVFVIGCNACYLENRKKIMVLNVAGGIFVHLSYY